MTSVVDLRDVRKSYRRGREDVHALRGISLSVNQGEFVAIVGPSGSGKTTLLQMIGCVDRPTTGSVNVAGREVSTLPEKVLTEVRARLMGFVFQQFFLLPTLTALENVQLPGLFARGENVGTRAGELLERVGLSGRLGHRPTELSGGEMQRVAIARALVNRPRVLLADEPTGNLDTENARLIMNLFSELNREGQTILMVTHNPELAAGTRRQVRMRDGTIIG
jgi:putative ABC transport system ATP-binding protein